MTQRPDQETIAGGTVRLHRVFATRPEKVFRAFLDAEAMAKWMPPNGFTCKVHHMDAKVGGTFKMSFTNFTANKGHSFGGEYLEIVPNERFATPIASTIPTTWSYPGDRHLKAVSVGTEINIEQANIPAVDSGRSLLSGLATVAHPACVAVEPEIPG